MTERTTVRLPETLVRRAKMKATQDGRSLTSLIEEGLRWVLDEPPPLLRAARVLPPVSTVVGGVLPGIDISNSAALQEMDDLEYVKRLK